MKIADIQKNILDMNKEELRQLLLRVRKDRRVSKEKPKARKERARSKDKLGDLLRGMSPEELEALRKAMEG